MNTRILFVNGSPRSKNNTSYMVQRAIDGASADKNVCIETFEFADKNFAGCKGTCTPYCMKKGTCSTKDDFQPFMEAFLRADGIVWAAPTYHAGPPAQVKAALDRLGNVLFSYMKGQLPRFNKACGIITNGSSRWGGQELTVQFFLESIVQLKCLPVAGDSPKSNLAVIGYAPTWEVGSILEDEVALNACENLGKCVADTAKIIRCGIEAAKEGLSERFFPDKMMDDRRNSNADVDMAWQKR